MKNIITHFINSLPQQYHHFGDGYCAVKRFYRNAQWWSKEEIESWQLGRLQHVVKKAYNNTNGYRQLYEEAHIKPDDIQKLSDIKYLPFTSKELLRDNVVDFTWSKRNGKLHKCATSGSTGVPFTFYANYNELGTEYSFMDTLWETTGWKINDVGLRIRGGISAVNNRFSCERLGYNRYAISSQFLNEANYDRIIEIINNKKVTFLHVYPSTIADLSSMIISRGDEGKLPIQSIFVGSEKYYTWQYDLTKKAFPNSKIMHWYGQSERVILAGWCEKNNLFHVIPYYGYSEVINEEQQNCSIGETGELVGTSFWMQGTFFIRYRTGDRATLAANDECDCGRNFCLFSSIEGRKQDFVIDKNGNKMSLTVFDGWAMHGDFFSNVHLFRFVQDTYGQIQLKIVPKKTFSEDALNSFKNEISKFFGDCYDVEVLIVNELQRSKSGKYSYLEQKLSIN